MTFRSEMRHPWEFYRDGDEITVVFKLDRPWWKVWAPREYLRAFSRQDVILFYQGLAKTVRPVMIREGEIEPNDEEIFRDLQQSFTQAVQRDLFEHEMDERGIRYIAGLMQAKGWKKW